MHTYINTDRQTDRQTDMNTDRQSDRHACIHAGDVTIMASMTSAVAESKAHFGKDAWGLGVPANLSARVYVHEYMYIFVCARECSREAAATRSPCLAPWTACTH